MLSALRRLETTDGRMNQSLSSSRNQQGDLNWVLESWDRSSSGAAVGGSGGGGFLTRNHQGGELDNSSMLAAALPHNNTAASWSAASDGHGVVEPKVYISPRQQQQQQFYNNNNTMQSSSPNLAHNHHHMMGGVPLTLSALESHHQQHHHQQQQQQHYDQNSSLQPFMNIPGVVPSGSSHVDFIRSSFEQQQQQRMGMYGGIMDMGHHHNQFSSLNSSSIKREDVYGDGYGRIGLNLGVRTYFSTEDMLAARLLGKRPRAGSPVPMCQAQGCKADLRMAKHYHRRHKVCEMHSKASTVTANGQTQRFCQQCSRFHALTEFDEGKRSCRKRLADHNRRRRKPQATNATGAAAASTTDEEHQSEASTKVNNELDLKKNSSTSASDNSDGSVKLQNSATTSSEEKIVEPHPTLLSESELATGTTTLSSQQPEARNNQQQQQHQQHSPKLSLGASANNPDHDDTRLRKRELTSITSNPSAEFTRSSDQQQAVHSQPLQSCSNWPVAETGPRFHWYS